MRLADDKTISKTAYMIDITVNGIVELRGYFAPVMPRNLVGRRLINHKKWILNKVQDLHNILLLVKINRDL